MQIDTGSISEHVWKKTGKSILRSASHFYNSVSEHEMTAIASFMGKTENSRTNITTDIPSVVLQISNIKLLGSEAVHVWIDVSWNQFRPEKGTRFWEQVTAHRSGSVSSTEMWATVHWMVAGNKGTGKKRHRKKNRISATCLFSSAFITYIP